MRTAIVLYVVGLFLGANARASILGDLLISGGYTKVSPGASATTYQLGGGAALGLLFAHELWIGALSDYRLIKQSKASPLGSLSGKRWNTVAPGIAYVSPRFMARLDAEFLGDLNLTPKGLDGESVSYTKPVGGKIELFYRHRAFLLGVFYEYLQFKNQKVGVVLSPLAKPMIMTQMGLSLGFAFGGMTK